MLEPPKITPKRPAKSEMITHGFTKDAYKAVQETMEMSASAMKKKNMRQTTVPLTIGLFNELDEMSIDFPESNVRKRVGLFISALLSNVMQETFLDNTVNKTRPTSAWAVERALKERQQIKDDFEAWKLLLKEMLDSGELESDDYDDLLLLSAELSLSITLEQRNEYIAYLKDVKERLIMDFYESLEDEEFAAIHEKASKFGVGEWHTRRELQRKIFREGMTIDAIDDYLSVANNAGIVAKNGREWKNLRKI